MRFVQWCSPELPFLTWLSRKRIPKLSSTASPKTTEECPRENQKPTLSGRLPSAISLRVVLSMAEMWSASNAWRIPRVYAKIPVPNPNSSVRFRW